MLLEKDPVSAKQTTELDAEIVAAFEALDATEPEGDLDEFEHRLLARLEEEDMSEIANVTTTTAEDPDSAAMGNTGALQASDDPELHDIKAMAESTKLRISQRMAAQVDAEDALLSASSSGLALRTISLPEPGKDYQAFTGDAEPAATAAAHEEDTGLPAWIYAAISAVAAAAIVFFILRGQKTEQPRVALQDSPATMPADPLAPAGSGQAGPGTAAWASGNGTAGELADREGGADTIGGATAGSDNAMATVQGAANDQDGADGDAKDSSAEAKRAATSSRTADTAARSTRRASASTAGSKADPAADKSAAGTQSGDPAADTSTAAKKPAKKPDALEDLLAEASGGAAGNGTAGAGQQAGATESKPARTQLERGDIKKAMTPIGPKAQACYDQTQLSGMVTVMIEFRVEPSGAISSASAKGKFKGTPTGDCVASAVKTATLPAYDGAPMSFTYPFLLTQ
jgi:hypothetical protein